MIVNARSLVRCRSSRVESRQDSRETLISPMDPPPSLVLSHQPCHIFKLPVELRNNIYRCIVIGRLDCCSRPHLWRPLGVDGGIHRIGYFDRDTVIPLLLTSRQIHDEAVNVLYGENTFTFHISGLAEGPISFLQWLAPRYIRLLRRVYIRTGYHVESYRFRSEHIFGDREYIEPTAEAMKLKGAHHLAISVNLMRQAWPAKYKVIIDKLATVSYSVNDSANFFRKPSANDWPASSFHLWKMFVTETEAEMPTIEFRRVQCGE